MSKSMLTNSDLQAISDLLDKQTAVLATKEELRAELNSLETSLKSYIHEGVETVMDGMDALAEKLDVRDRVDKLEREVLVLKH